MPASHPVHGPDATSRFHATPVQVVARALGMAFVVVGVLGFIADLTGAAVFLDALDPSVLRNVGTVAFGVAGLVLARTFRPARAYLIGGGALYLMASGARAIGTAGSVGAWSGVTVGVGMAVLGIVLGRRRR